MSEWVEFNGFGCFRLIEAKNKYTIEQKQDEDIIPFAFHNQPFTPYLKQGTKFFDAFYRFAEDNWSAKDIKSFDEIFSEFAIELLKNRVTQDELEQRDQLRKESAERRVQNQYKDYYESLYSDFKDYKMIYNLSSLEMVVATARCLCADSVREVVRAFIGYFQTVNGFKATNVIAIGSPASGKSFILETALSMIPQEFVHYGSMTESAFFETFDGQDLTGHIFMLGDLGGAKSDEKTIIFRDLLKELSTDGEVSRTISKGDNKDREPVRQIVKGKPSLTYSTAHEEIVNEQEKSRSVILTPQPINPRALLTFNAVMRNNGCFWEDIEEVNRARDSIKGMVYCYNHDKDGDFFNPYMFNIESSLEDNDDFNRKIQEYDATLEVVTRLDNPYSIKHGYYLDESNKACDTDLVLATKRNNLNAMNLFDAVNFLPDEARLGDKLLEKYEVFDLDELETGGSKLDSSKTFEEQVIESITDESHEWVSDDEYGTTWLRNSIFNSHNGFFSDLSPYFKDKVFTVGTLKKRFRGKWFNSQKGYLSHRLMKLYDGGVLIKLGKTNDNQNLYALSNENGSKISEKLPSFDDLSKIKECKDVFVKIYPSMSQEWDEFLDYDHEKPEEKSITESVPALFPNLPYIKGGDSNV